MLEHVKSHRTGIYKELEACFETSALPKAAAIQQAEAIRDMKQAQGQTGNKRKNCKEETQDNDSIDLAAFQQAWGRLKFG
ncbi:MAG: DNA phosphorothioation system sulfurtransferase DndC, partial [Leptolyngbya sp. SIO1D8]|nr:DNA phosphorothioation system sulfurtransferase DndC [Leptolyngbya sp. SIO1D8]